METNILLIGYDTNICLGVLFCLKDIEGSIFLLTHKKNNPAKYSKYLKGYYEYDELEEKDRIVDKIIKITESNNIHLIMPIDENEVRLVSEYKDLLNTYAKCSLLPSVENFDIGVNKRRLAEILMENKVPSPPFIKVSNDHDVFLKAEQFGYPVLVKPSRGYSGYLIQRINNEIELLEFLQKETIKESEFILQPFINGADIDCSVICKDGEIICYTIQQAISNDPGFKPKESIEFVHDIEVLHVSSQMMKILNWNGVAHIDLRRDNLDGKVKVLEINGRFWSSLVASHLKAKVNFPYIHVMLSLGKYVDAPEQKLAKQLSMKDYFKAKLSFGKNASLSDTKYGYYKSDMLARSYQILEKLK